jgi:hypothetical protein
MSVAALSRKLLAAAYHRLPDDADCEPTIVSRAK